MDKKPKPAGGPGLRTSPEISANSAAQKNLQKFTNQIPPLKMEAPRPDSSSYGEPLWFCPCCVTIAGTAYKKGDQCIVCLSFLEIWNGQPMRSRTAEAQSAALAEALRWKAGEELLEDFWGQSWPCGLGNEVAEEIRRRVLLYDEIVKYWRKGARVAPR